METHLGARILPALYACCEHPERWRSVLDDICGGLGVRSAAVQLYRRSGAGLLRGWQERDSLSHAHADAHDRWINNATNPRLAVDPARLPRASAMVMTDRERFAPGAPAMQQTQHLLAQIGLRGGTGILLEFAPERFLSLILHRALEDSGEKDDQDREFLEAIAPHLQCIAGLSARLQAAQAAEATLASMLDRLRVGIVFCSRLGEVRWRNLAALQMLQKDSSLMIRRDILHATSDYSRRQLNSLLSGTAHAHVAACFERQSGRHIQALALPIDAVGDVARRDWAASDSDVALVLIDPGQAPQLAAEPVMALFGLTPAEAQLAVALSQGRSLSEYASHRGVSVGTVRVQMKRILDKTGSRRQADLVGKLYASVVAQLQGEHH